MASPNYGYEKRQKELAKKKKKEEKLKARADRKLGIGNEELPPGDPDVVSLERGSPTVPELPTKDD